jgi:hypothetical protein
VWIGPIALGDQAAPESDCDGVRPAPGLELGEQVPNVGLNGFFRKVEPVPDLAVYKTIGDELQDLDFAHRGLLLELAKRRLERNDLGVLLACVSRSGLVEAAGVVQVSAQDVFTLGSVHCTEYRQV